MSGARLTIHAETIDPARLLDESDCVPEITEGLAREPAKPFFEFLDEPQRTVSTGIEHFAQAIDEYFAKEKVSYDSSGTYVQFIGDILFAEPGDVSSQGDVRIRLRVPHTQEKLKLLLESDPEEQRSTVDRLTNQTPSEQDRRAIYAGVETELGEAEAWEFKPSAGLKLRFPLEYYIRLRASRTYQFENWQLYLSQTPYWFDTTGFGFDSNMEWSYPLDIDLLFRSVSLVRYTDERDMFDFAQTLSLINTLSPSRAVTYEVAAFADTEPAIMATQYLLLVRYRQRIHSDYLFLEIVPQLRYRKEFGFNDEPSLLLRLEFLFQS